MKQVAFTRNQVDSGAMVLPPCVSQCPSDCMDSRILRRLMRTLKKGGLIGLIASECFKNMPDLQEPFTDPPNNNTEPPEVAVHHPDPSPAREEPPKAAEKDKGTPKVQFVDPPRVNDTPATKVQQPPKPQPKKSNRRRSDEEDDPSYLPSKNTRAKSVGPRSNERAKSVAPSNGREKSVPPSTSQARPRFERAESVAPSTSRAKSVAPSNSREKSVPPSTSRARPRFERAKSVAPSVGLRDAVPVKPNPPAAEPAKSFTPAAEQAKSSTPPAAPAKSSMPLRSRAKSVAPSVNQASSVMPPTKQAKSNTNTPSARQEKLAAALATREKSPSPLSSQVSKILESLQRIEDTRPSLPSTASTSTKSTASTSTPSTSATTIITSRPNPSGSTDISLPSSSAERELPDDDVVIIENEPRPTPRPFVANTYFSGGIAKLSTATPTMPALPPNITVNGRTFHNFHDSSLPKPTPPDPEPAPTPALIPAPKQKKTAASQVPRKRTFPPPNIIPLKRQKIAETVPSDTENVADTSQSAKPAEKSFSIAPRTPATPLNVTPVPLPLTQFRPFRNPNTAQYFAFEALPNLQLPPLPTHMNLRSTQVDLNLKCIRFAFVHHVDYYSYIIDFKKFKPVPLTCQLEFFNANTRMWDRQDCESVETGNCSVGHVKYSTMQENMFFTVVCTDAAGRKTVCPVIVVDKPRLNARCEVVFEPDLIVIDDD